MNNGECAISEREQTRKDFSPEFIKDVTNRGPQHGHDPRNNIGVSCGVSWGAVYRVWDNLWFHNINDHKHFQNQLRWSKDNA